MENRSSRVVPRKHCILGACEVLSGPKTCAHGITQRVPAFLHALFPFFSITNNHVYPNTGKSSIEKSFNEEAECTPFHSTITIIFWCPLQRASEAVLRQWSLSPNRMARAGHQVCWAISPRRTTRAGLPLNMEKQRSTDGGVREP